MGEAFPQVWTKHCLFGVGLDGSNPGQSNRFVVHTRGTVLPASRVSESQAGT